jgi:hypothetical protein
VLAVPAIASRARLESDSACIAVCSKFYHSPKMGLLFALD